MILLNKESNMQKVSIVQHKGKAIVGLDFSGLKYLEVLARIGEYKAFISNQKEKSLLVLTDVSGCEINKRTVEAFKEFTVHNKPYVIASAVFGLSGFPRIFVNVVNQFSKRDINLFNDSMTAKDWLISQSR